MGGIRGAAEAGRLRVEPDLAADAIGTAVRGIGAMVSSEAPSASTDAVNALIRDAVLGALFTEIDEGDGDTAAHALALAEVARAGGAGFTGAESALLEEWLGRLATVDRKEVRR